MYDDQIPSAQTEAQASQSTAANGEGRASPDDLQTQLDAANARADENHQRFLLAVADFENYKKRIERQFADIALAGRRALLRQLLPVIDNLERALAVDDASQGLRGGVQQTLKGFESVLAAEGVRPITDIVGRPFDPKIADAIGTRAVEDVAEDTIVEQTQKGYLLGDEVLRPAKVIVAKNEAAGELEA